MEKGIIKFILVGKKSYKPEITPLIFWDTVFQWPVKNTHTWCLNKEGREKILKRDDAHNCIRFLFKWNKEGREKIWKRNGVCSCIRFLFKWTLHEWNRVLRGLSLPATSVDKSDQIHSASKAYWIKLEITDWAFNVNFSFSFFFSCV